MRTDIKILKIGFVAIYLFVVLVGLLFSMRNMDHGMMTCVFAKEPAAYCHVDVMEHVASWSNLFTAKVVSIVVLVLLSLVALYITRNETFELSISGRWLRDILAPPRLLIPLAIASEQGILQPRK